MKISKLLSTSVGLLLLGAAVAFFWIYLSGGEHLTSLTQPHYGYILALPAITAFCILGRFVRWQFLLRRVKVRVPIRTAFSIFLASLAGTATPAYVGEAIRSVFLRRDFRIPARLSLWVLLVERLFDIMALGLLGALAAENLWIRVITALFATGAWLVWRFGGPLARAAGVPENVGSGLRHYEIAFQVLGITLIAWIPAPC